PPAPRMVYMGYSFRLIRIALTYRSELTIPAQIFCLLAAVWRIDAKGLLCRRRTVHLRSAPPPQEITVRILPRRHFIALLGPVGEGSFIAAVQKLAHRFPVRVFKHESLHRFFGVPAGTGPECIATIAKELPPEVPPCTACLLRNARGGED